GEEKDNESYAGNIIFNNLFEDVKINKKELLSLKKGESISIIVTKKEFRNFDPDSDIPFFKLPFVKLIIKRVEDIEQIRYVEYLDDNIKDILNEQELEEYKRILNETSRSLNLGISAFDYNSGKIFFTTRQWYDNTCLKNISGKEKGPEDLLGFLSEEENSDIRGQITDMVSGRKEQSVVSREIKIHRDGQFMRWLRFFVYYVPYFGDGRYSNDIIMFTWDISELKKSENQLIEANIKARSAEKDTDDFLKNISHEVRTPINSIIGFSKLIHTEKDKDTVDSFKKIIWNNNLELHELIKKIMLLSKFDLNTIEISSSEVNLNELISMLGKIAEERIPQEKQLEIISYIPQRETIIYSDAKLIKQALLCLISNSIKFTESGEISIGYTINENKVTFFVEDSGIGFPQNNYMELLQRFKKGNPFYHGTGLGLSLFDVIVEKGLRGTFDMKNNKKGGASISFTITPPFKEI
ncbi:MAG: HAMP domain-containing histidine kinase, partial [Bacteroidales bacterium]|nr:HAMP domain-containing histidine kinase [Bacteroidales bacterium]